MAVQKQFVNSPLSGSLDTKTDPKIAPFPGFSLIENGIRTRAGEVRKRFGLSPLPFTMGTYPAKDSGPDVSFAYGVAQFEDESLLIARGSVGFSITSQYIYRNYNSKWNSYSQSRIPEIQTVEVKQVSQNPLYNVEFLDCDEGQNKICTVYSRTEPAPDALSNVYMSLYDIASDTNLKTDILLSDNVSESYKPRVCYVDGVFQIIFLNDVTHELILVNVNATTGIVSASIVLKTDCAPNARFMCEIVSVSTGAIIGYTRDAMSNSRLTFLKINTAGAILASYDEDTIDVKQTFAMTVSGSAVYIAFWNTNIYALSLHPTTLAVITATTNIEMISHPYAIGLCYHLDENELRFYYSTSEHTYWLRTNATFGVLYASERIVNNAGIASTAIVSTTKDSVLGANKDDMLLASVGAPGAGYNFSTLFWGPELKSKMCKDTAALDYLDKTSIYSLMPSAVKVGTRTFIPYRVAVASTGAVTSAVIAGAALVVVHTSPNASQFSSVYVNGTTLFGGGVVRSFDGQNTTELGWNTIPAPVEIGPDSATGGNMGPGAYQYVNIYEWIDAKGNLHRSGVSVPRRQTVGAGGTSKVPLSLWQYGITTRNSSNGYSNSHGRIVLYRTKADGTIFYKHSEHELQSNDASLVQIQFDDVLPDSSLSSQILYTTGGVLENESPPASNILAVFKNRVFAVSSEDDCDIWYSQELVKNEAPQFSSFLRFRVESIGGSTTGVAEMDEKVFVFKENAIFYTMGDGANALGIGGFNPVSLLTTEIGCIEPKSIARINSGIIFKSKRGFYLLDRGMNLQYVGAKVELYNDLSIYSAVVIPSQNQVRFTTSQNKILVFEDLFNEWYVWSASSYNFGGYSAALDNGNYCFLSLSGQILKENSGFLDGTITYKMRAITLPIQVADVQGYQRLFKIQVLGEYRGAHRVKMSLAYDHKEYFEETFSKVPTSDYLWNDSTYQLTTLNIGGTKNNVWQFEVRPKKQKCSSVRIMFEDDFVGISGNGQSFTISSIGFEVGVLGGRNRVSPTTRVMT